MMPVYAVVALVLLAFLVYRASNATRFVLRDGEIDPDLAALDPDQAELQQVINEYDDYSRRAE